MTRKKRPVKGTYIDCVCGKDIRFTTSRNVEDDLVAVHLDKDELFYFCSGCGRTIRAFVDKSQKEEGELMFDYPWGEER